MLKEKLKNRYQRLNLEDKKRVGESLVKVNMGLASPDELRLVADFLHGTGIVAKKGTFDGLIVLLNDNTEEKAAQAMREKTELVEHRLITDEELLEQLQFHREDEDETVKVSQVD